MAEITQLNISKLYMRLDNLTRKDQCAIPVCSGLEVPDVLDYHYPMSIAQTATLAKEARFSERIAQSDIVVGSQSEDTKPEEEKVPLAPFKPDWRFWTGLTLSGLGFFLHRNR